jgi:gas vesicle protein
MQQRLVGGAQHQHHRLQAGSHALRRQRQSSGIGLRREGGSVSTGPSRLVCQSSRGKSERSFWGGFLIGGTVFGVLGFLFAPQVSRALLNSERMKKLLGEGSENLEITREVLNDKISELNEAIDGVSAQLQTNNNDNVRTGSE